MSDRPVKIPDASHPIHIEAADAEIQVSANGDLLARSRYAILLTEASYPTVAYIPRADAVMEKLERSDHHTWCPYKGECSYFHIRDAGERGRNAVWSYEEPHAAVARIKEHLAFYPDRVRIETL